MKQVLYGILMVLLATGCSSKKDNKTSTKTTARENNRSSLKSPLRTLKEKGVAIAVYDFESFKPFLHQKNDTVYVINFWATWCKPCVKELPGFENINKKYNDGKVKVLLVSMDFPNKIKSQLIPFIKKKGLKSQIIVLDEPDANSWIDKIDENWSGAVPATLIYNKQKRFFYPKPFTYNELETEINKLIITKN